MTHANFTRVITCSRGTLSNLDTFWWPEKSHYKPVARFPQTLDTFFSCVLEYGQKMSTASDSLCLIGTCISTASKSATAILYPFLGLACVLVLLHYSVNQCISFSRMRKFILYAYMFFTSWLENTFSCFGWGNFRAASLLVVAESCDRASSWNWIISFMDELCKSQTLANFS